MMALNLTGEMVELGELDDELGAHGFVLHRADGSFVTVKGLTADEVRAVAGMLFGAVDLHIDEAQA